MQIDRLPLYTLSVHHDGSTRYVRPAGARLGEEVSIRLRMAPHAPVERVLLRTCPDGEQHFVEMTVAERGPAAWWWQATLRVSMPLVGYRFLIFAQDGVWWYNAGGPQRHTPTDAQDFRLLAGYEAPAWVRASVFYQIFPDRFADGDPSNNVRDGEFAYRGHASRARRWSETPGRGIESLLEFFGGDLQGIEQHLDYLADLGVNALYLNPVFTAYSNHRYDVVDYYQVDRHLGGDGALAALRRATTERGMRYILDIVPNHCGVLHPWFQAAVADQRAASAEYFTFHHYPEDYACWLGVRSLPKLNYRSAALRRVMYEGPDAVFRYWLRPPYSADGWRIDVANMLARQGADQMGTEIARGIRRAVKAENPEAYLLGENFFDASAQLQGDNWDASMNYAGFMQPLWYWLAGFYVGQHAEPRRVESRVPWSTRALVDTWQAFRAAIPWAIARQQFNLLGSHDTPRMRKIAGGDPGLERLAAALLLTYPGVPSVYYGDEIGLLAPGYDDAREPMPWERARWDHDLRAFYQALIRLRRTSPALLDGGFQVLAAEDERLAYLRDSDEELLIVVAARGAQPAGALRVAHGGIADGTEFREIFSGQALAVRAGALALPAQEKGATVWQSKR